MSSFALSPHSLTVHVLESEKMDKFLEALDCWFFYCEFRSMFIFYDIWLNILNGSRQSSDTSRSCQAWLLGFYFRDPPQLPFPLAIQISLVLWFKKTQETSLPGVGFVPTGFNWIWWIFLSHQVALSTFLCGEETWFQKRTDSLTLERQSSAVLGVSTFFRRNISVCSDKMIILFGGHPQTSQVYTKFWPY